MKTLINRIYNRIRRDIVTHRETRAARRGSAAYWTVHMVPTDSFKSADNSLDLFHWRNAQYPGYIDLMPVSGQDGKVVLDYGCGPGNDVVGFAVFSNPLKLIAVDVSKSAIQKAQERLAVHGKTAEFIHIDEIDNTIPLPSESVDYIHSSGVLHHCANLEAVLKEFHRILKPGGEIAVMVYNYQSVWLHLYVAWMHQLERGRYQNLPVLDAFRRTTDGEGCPIAHCYSPEQFLDLMQKNGFKGTFTGSAVSLTEMKCLEKRYDAIKDRRLPSEHRDFLSALTFDKRGIPYYKGSVAGIDACYKFKK
jgi:ubiquinone/menaquinone biosynthesis C-methylase UbiE